MLAFLLVEGTHIGAKLNDEIDSAPHSNLGQVALSLPRDGASSLLYIARTIRCQRGDALVRLLKRPAVAASGHACVQI